jgi:hypothetical protein
LMLSISMGSNFINFQNMPPSLYGRDGGSLSLF